MNTLEIPETGRKIYLPSDLAECDERQYAEVSELLYQYQEGNIGYHDFRIHAVYALLDMQVSPNSDDAAQERKAANIYVLSELLDSFFERVDDKNQLKQYYTKNHTPVIRPKFLKYYGPWDNFENVEFGQYVDGLNYYEEYNETKDKEFLYLLMAFFYKRKGKDYSSRKSDQLVKDLKLIQFGKVYGFYLLFASFQKYLVSSKIYWMGKELELSILFEGDSKHVDSGLPGLGLKSTLYSLAESGVFGSLNQVRREDFWEVIMRMYDIVKKDRDFKVRQEQAQSKIE